jgi:hypothetical protein
MFVYRGISTIEGGVSGIGRGPAPGPTKKFKEKIMVENEQQEVKEFGTYPGYLTPDAIKALEEGPEVAVYLAITEIGGFMWTLKHDASGRQLKTTPEQDAEFVEAHYALEFVVLKTRRFGVEIADPEPGGHVERTESYNAWFRRWDGYIKSLSELQWSELTRRLANNDNVLAFQPPVG